MKKKDKGTFTFGNKAHIEEQCKVHFTHTLNGG